MQEEFSQRLIDSQERERRRVSNEMHDSLGQHVAVLKKKARAGLELAGHPAAAGAFAEIAALAETVDTEMKEIAYAVRPHHLDTIGLSRTIETMVTRVGRACDIQLTADIIPIDDRVPEASHIHIFRIVQEAVSNIVKHSGATRATVSVSQGPRSIVITVEDNGKGFSPDDLDAARLAMHGAGLVGIRERARILGGRVEIQSNAAAGTMLTVTLPLEDTAHG
jgi:signal transduction histidine kinase